MALATRVLAVLALVCSGLLLSPGRAEAAEVSARLDGRAISLERAGGLSCHDFDFPVLTCFETSNELLAAASRRSGQESAGPTVDSATVVSVGYIVVFEHGAYAGAAQALSQDYSYLGSIGWNDKISSLKSYGATGHFWEHSPGSGLIYYFYSTSQITYVGNTYNDKFSALYFS